MPHIKVESGLGCSVGLSCFFLNSCFYGLLYLTHLICIVLDVLPVYSGDTLLFLIIFYYLYKFIYFYKVSQKEAIKAIREARFYAYDEMYSKFGDDGWRKEYL